MLDRLRLATALAHSVAGVTLHLELGRSPGQQRPPLVVAHHRLDAHLTPCQLRSAMLMPERVGRPRFVDIVEDVDVVVGLEELGGGLYRRHGADGEERWFATLLSYDAANDLLDRCPIDVPDESMAATLKPDLELGATAVCLSANHPSQQHQLDVVAAWALGACMVEELLCSSRSEARRSQA